MDCIHLLQQAYGTLQPKLHVFRSFSIGLLRRWRRFGDRQGRFVHYTISFDPFITNARCHVRAGAKEQARDSWRIESPQLKFTHKRSVLEKLV